MPLTSPPIRANPCGGFEPERRLRGGRLRSCRSRAPRPPRSCWRPVTAEHAQDRPKDILPSIQYSNPSLGSKLQEEEDRRLERLTSLRPRLGGTENGRARLEAQQQVVLSLGHVLDAIDVWAPTRARLRHQQRKLLRLPRLLDDRRDAHPHLLH